MNGLHFKWVWYLQKIVGTIEGPTKENDSHDWPFQNKPVGG